MICAGGGAGLVIEAHEEQPQALRGAEERVEAGLEGPQHHHPDLGVYVRHRHGEQVAYAQVPPRHLRPRTMQ